MGVEGAVEGGGSGTGRTRGDWARWEEAGCQALNSLPFSGGAKGPTGEKAGGPTCVRGRSRDRLLLPEPPGTCASWSELWPRRSVSHPWRTPHDRQTDGAWAQV